MTTERPPSARFEARPSWLRKAAGRWVRLSVKTKTSLVAGAAALGTTFLGTGALVVLHGELWAAMPQILAILGVAVVSVTAVVWALRRMLAPIDELEHALKLYRKKGFGDALPKRHRRAFGELSYLVDGILSDARAEIDLNRLVADTDPLTGLWNRRGFDRNRQGLEAGSLIFLDLDNFKHVNDRLGHDAGDLVLRQTAVLLSNVLRQDELVARFGGEEFVVYLPGIDLGTAAQVADRIRNRAEQALKTVIGRVTLSAGVAQQRPGESFGDTLMRADEAVYMAKREGRNCVRVHDPQTGLRPPIATAAE